MMLVDITDIPLTSRDTDARVFDATHFVLGQRDHRVAVGSEVNSQRLH